MDNREKQAAFKARMRERGMVQITEWIPVTERERIKGILASMREGRPIDASEPNDRIKAFLAAVAPLVETFHSEGKKNAATASPGAVAFAAYKLHLLLLELEGIPCRKPSAIDSPTNTTRRKVRYIPGFLDTKRKGYPGIGSDDWRAEAAARGTSNQTKLPATVSDDDDDDRDELASELAMLRSVRDVMTECLSEEQRAAIGAEALERVNAASGTSNQTKPVSAGPDLSAFDAPDTHAYSIKPKIGAESEQIIVHGQVIWPNDSGRYSFGEAWRAFHLWQDLDRSLAQTGDSPSARGVFFMQIKAWMEGISHGFAVAWHKIATAQHNHPEQASETRGPSRHFNAK